MPGFVFVWQLSCDKNLQVALSGRIIEQFHDEHSIPFMFEENIAFATVACG